MYKVNVTKISCNVNCCIHAHILKHTQVCVCTLTHTRRNIFLQSGTGGGASIFHSWLNCLKGQNYAVSQHFVCITSDGNQHFYTHGMQLFILTVFSLAGTLIAWFLVSVRTLADEAALCVLTHLTAGTRLFFTLIDVWGEKRERTNIFNDQGKSYTVYGGNGIQ